MNLLGYEQEICRKAVEKYGPELQTDQLVEELAELIVILKHWDRNRVGFKAVLDEVADVYIMLTQFRQMYSVGDAQMSEAISDKIGKLSNRLQVSEDLLSKGDPEC